jgi:hypothetical protein
MNKTLIGLIFATMIFSTITADAFADVKKIFKNDQCASDSMESLRPELEEKIAAVKNVKL